MHRRTRYDRTILNEEAGVEWQELVPRTLYIHDVSAVGSTPFFWLYICYLFLIFLGAAVRIEPVR
jgi:hypothetical protein